MAVHSVGDVQGYEKKFGPVFPTKIEVVTSPDGKRTVVAMAVEQLIAWVS